VHYDGKERTKCERLGSFVRLILAATTARAGDKMPASGELPKSLFPRRGRSCSSFLRRARGPIPPQSLAGLFATAIALKKTLLASECDRPDIRQAREEWRTERQPRMRLEPHRLVFLDETGTTTKMTRLRGRCLKGKRLRSKAPFGHWKTQTFVAGLRCGALTAPFVIDAPMDRRIFEIYVETQLVPTLEKGDIVIMDNLPAHKSPIAEKAILEQGAAVLWTCPAFVESVFDFTLPALRTEAD
jgi:DDE superfamily endonuclease